MAWAFRVFILRSRNRANDSNRMQQIACTG
jgi:hypothetical protein